MYRPGGQTEDKSHRDVPESGWAPRKERPQAPKRRLHTQVAEQAGIPGRPGEPRAPPTHDRMPPSARPHVRRTQLHGCVLPRHHLLILLSDEGRGCVCAHLCAMQAVGGAHLPTQQRGGRGGGQGLLRRPLAGFLELMLNEVLQGGELCLAAATSVHVVLICKKPTVRGTGGGGALVLGTPSQGWHQNQTPTPGRTAHGRGQP